MRIEMKRTSVTAIACAIVASALLPWGVRAQANWGSDQDIPEYKAQTPWPKPLPNNWMLGHTETVIVDKDDHIWVAHYVGPMDRRMDHSLMGLNQVPPIAECCIPAPEIMQFDEQGNVLRAWGGPGYIPQWPEAVHAFWVDKQLNVWVAGNHGPDRNLLKFTVDGKFLLEIGRLDTPVGQYRSIRGEQTMPDNQATDKLGGPAGITVDDEANEVYVADGFINKRVMVYDSNTGKFKRGWGGYGIPLSEIPNTKLARNVAHGADREPFGAEKAGFTGPIEGIRISNDGLVYVGDRDGGRIQIFSKQGGFVKEIFTGWDHPMKGWLPSGFTFSRDPEQKYLIVTDGTNQRVRILRRDNGAEVSNFGSFGKNAGQFGSHLNWVDIDSKGNMYTLEVRYMDRAQKFVPVRKK